MAAKLNHEHQRDYTDRQLKAGLVVFRQWITDEEKMVLEFILERMRDDDTVEYCLNDCEI